MAVIDGKWLSKEGLTYFWSKIKSIFTKQTETNVIANLGAKNLVEIIATSQTKNGITFTVNDDGSVSMNGTATKSVTFALNDKMSLPNGQYILSGTVPNNVYLTARSTSGTNYTVTHSSPEIKINADIFYVYVNITSGTALNNVVVKPMLRLASITDSTFQPYAPTNRELYETRFASKMILPDNVDLNDIKKGGIYNGVNSTGNSAVHMPVATGSFNFVLTVIEANEFIIQIFKQLNSAGDPNFYVRRFYIYNSDWDSWYQFTGTQV